MDWTGVAIAVGVLSVFALWAANSMMRSPKERRRAERRHRQTLADADRFWVTHRWANRGMLAAFIGVYVVAFGSLVWVFI